MKKNQPSLVIPLAVGVVCAGLLLTFWLSGDAVARRLREPRPSSAARPPAAINGLAAKSAADDSALANALTRRLLADLLRPLDVRGARPREAVLTFKDDAAYQRFIARAGASGLNVLGRLDALRTVRVGYDALTDLEKELVGNSADYSGLAANPLVRVPTVPTKDERAPVNSVALGNNLLEFLGVAGDPGQLGRGVTIAVLDTGIAADSTFGNRVRTLDLGLGFKPGTGAEDGHGTAVAALAAGASGDAQGVAPGANLLSIRVTDATGTSDIFTVAQGILAATDAGARLINVSLGGYDTSPVLSQAIDYATRHGALIIASAGNDQATQLTWPAADPRVVSVGAVDALGQQVMFSNSGAGLSITAPGYGVQTAWLDSQRVTIDGTSASAPVVTGSIAALMSANPGISAAQAWEILRQHTNDGGAPGADSDYGNGVVNLGWAMNASNPSYADTAVSSHYYDAATGTMEFVIQNRGGSGVGGLQLVVSTGGASTSTYTVPVLAPGATYVAKMPVDQAALAAAGGLAIRTTLVNPAGLTDQVPANNKKSSYLSPPAGK